MEPATGTDEDLGLSVREEAETGDIWARYEPQAITPSPLAPAQFRALMEQAGLKVSDYAIEPSTLATLRACMQRNEACDLRLGGPVDARPEAFVSANEMLAGVVVHPPRGKGKDLTAEALNEALRHANVVRGFLEDSLEALTSEALRQQLRETQIPIGMIVAFGELAIDGVDAWLEPLVETIVDRRPQVDEAGNVDFLELGDFPHIEAGQALVRHHPATEGKPGRTVTGRLVKGRDGKNIVFRPKDHSVQLDPEDEHLMIAATSGMPVVYSQGAYVEKVLHFEQVGIETGHIRFDGSVQVKGNVEPGMKIEVLGDVKVGGLVEAAHIQAGGAIEVNGGVIGRRQCHGDDHPSTEKSGSDGKDSAAGPIDDAYLKAGTQIKARFVQDATLEAGEEIIVQKQIFHSSIKAGTRVLLPGRGVVVGGVVRAQEMIDIGVSGAMANVSTTLIAGESSGIKTRIADINEAINQIESQRKQLTAIVEKFVKQNKPITAEKKQKFLEARESLHQREHAHYDALAELKIELQQCQSARIRVRFTCYPGTLIKLADREVSPHKQLGNVTFVFKDGEILTR
ncbi:MAG: FapA family protein [Chromatiaceae bacterium]|nr:FapA family protein [Chromatiaceae bacterium]